MPADHAALHALAQEAAGAMGPGWTYRPPKVEAGEGLPRWAAVLHKDGYGFHIGRDWKDEGRLNISGEWPKDASGQPLYPTRVHYDAKSPEISVAAARGAKVISQEVTRRFLPAYLPMWQEAAGRVRREQEYQTNRSAVVDRLAKAVGGVPEGRMNRDGDGFSTYDSEGPYVTVKAFEKDVTLEFHNLPPEAAERLLVAAGIKGKR